VRCEQDAAAEHHARHLPHERRQRRGRVLGRLKCVAQATEVMLGHEGGREQEVPAVLVGHKDVAVAEAPHAPARGVRHGMLFAERQGAAGIEERVGPELHETFGRGIRRSGGREGHPEKVRIVVPNVKMNPLDCPRCC
jgi:hypothetical protein